MTAITYQYDSLGRLTEANYSGGNTYAYTYDAVGNRTKQTIMVNGQSSVVLYQYDSANRLTSVGGDPSTSSGQAYTWDANGNLLNDGVNTYTYDAANRLSTLNGPSSTVSYAYNGLGDRLKETVNGQTTTFAMDLNTGLTQALSDGTHTYLYGNGRIAQSPNHPIAQSQMEYFLTDALGSIRQLTNATGSVTLAKAYDPYGVVTQVSTGSTNASGASQTDYGYTGEYQANDLVYLRARHYAPSMGRFLSRDTWGGNGSV